MSEQNSTEMTFQIQRIYTKDISFEAPNAPQVFQKDWQPEVKLDLDTASTQLAEGVYEVVLRVTVTAALDHLLTLRGIAIDRQLMERYAFAVQQRFRADAERAGRFGVDLNIGHDFTPVVTLRVLRRSLCSLHVRREEKTRRHHHAR